MPSISVIGAGAFGTALAIALSKEGASVRLWGRSSQTLADMARTRTSARLPGATLPKNLALTSEISEMDGVGPLLLVTPTQSLRGVLTSLPFSLENRAVIACCKGIDLRTHTGPSRVISEVAPTAIPGVLTGPSFAADIARGLPTALTLACADEQKGRELQLLLSRQMLRLYLTTDVAGAELGGALKNVVAIACGAVMGSGLGDSARAALMTRGFAEMQRLALHFGARPETLAGLSGLGDLALTCTSDLSRNYQFGLALGRGEEFNAQTTVEGVSTARAVSELAREAGLDLPITHAVHAITSGNLTVSQALQTLLSRPLKTE